MKQITRTPEEKDYIKGRNIYLFILFLCLGMLVVATFCSCDELVSKTFVQRVEVVYTNGDKDVVYSEVDEGGYFYLESGCLVCSLPAKTVVCQIRSYKLLAKDEIK